VPLARLLRTHFLRDEADFVDLLPEDYDQQFLPDYDKKVTAADAVVSSKVARLQSQALGAELEAAGATLPKLLNRLEARARRAGKLTVPLKGLGLQQVRAAYELGDLERLDAALKVLLRNLGDNAAVLAAKGHTAAETTALRTLHETLMAGSLAQDESQTGSQRLTAENIGTLNALYAVMKPVLDDGKSLYRGRMPPSSRITR
jgi:hypothetical protein